MRALTARLTAPALLVQLLLHLLLPSQGPLLVLAAGAMLTLVVGSAAGWAVLGRIRVLAGVGAARAPAQRREYAWHTAFMPQRDPDARGRRRPRAPSARLRAVTG
ncbi:DUF6412 domain-containing protein [Streptacidiphilus jiangxiensis]|uniref:Uncharacterized protein n=1 Tax=Streptacidiphilus jiangxiensis TaxID=235985 RepID=A0A1H7ZGZ2_STRJI|nr:DUF6412 domain-containing protein [Streptacidiphilus jiangxiensis]SEM57606.1 hypothetical protein SAMN05414137_13521 [Streptacidiphilus jiangxiensis]